MDGFTLFVVAAFFAGAVLLVFLFKDILFSKKQYKQDVAHSYWFSEQTFETNVHNEVNTITGEPLGANSTPTSVGTTI